MVRRFGFNADSFSARARFSGTALSTVALSGQQYIIGFSSPAYSEPDTERE
jgi:hypothetical protein